HRLSQSPLQAVLWGRFLCACRRFVTQTGLFTPSFVMIFFVAQDSEGAIKLFQKYDPDEVVRECHVRKRHKTIGLCTYLRIEPEWADNDKGYTLEPGIHLFF